MRTLRADFLFPRADRKIFAKKKFRELAPSHWVHAYLNTANSAVHENLDDTTPWGAVAAIYRRICTLRFNGHTVEAARLQSTELSRALALVRTAADGGTEERLGAIFAAEEERVLNARALAELLAPMLSERLGALSRSFASAVSAPLRPLASPPTRDAGAVVAAATPTIADFIDEMLAQERPLGRETSRRRAS